MNPHISFFHCLFATSAVIILMTTAGFCAARTFTLQPERPSLRSLHEAAFQSSDAPPSASPPQANPKPEASPVVPLTTLEQRRKVRLERLALRPGPPEVPTVSPPRSDNKQGVYLGAANAGRDEFLTSTMDDLAAAGGNALVFDVKGSTVFFASTAPMATQLSLVTPQLDLPHVLDMARARGIYTIGRFVSIKDYGITKKLPATRVLDKEGKRVLSKDWVDPGNETAIDYNMQIICELAASGIDEINLDYIRFSTAEVGALRTYSGQEKADRIEMFLRATRETVDRCGPRTRLGISTYAILGWDYDMNVETLGQDVRRFAPLVDVISPMAYPATFTTNAYYDPAKHPVSRMYYLVYRTLTGYSELLGPEHAHKLRPWIQGYGVAKKDVANEIRAVYDAGLCGFQVWNANNNYEPTYGGMLIAPPKPEICL